MQKMGLILTARAVHLPRGTVGAGHCGAGGKRDLVDFVPGVFPVVCMPELHIRLQTEWGFCPGEDKLVFLQKVLRPFLSVGASPVCFSGLPWNTGRC